MCVVVPSLSLDCYNTLTLIEKVYMKSALTIFLCILGFWAIVSGIAVGFSAKSVVHEIYGICNYILGALWFILAKLISNTPSKNEQRALHDLK